MLCGAGKRALPSTGAFLGLGAVVGDFMCQPGEAMVPGEVVKQSQAAVKVCFKI